MWWPSYLYIIYMEEAPTIVIIYFSFLFFRENHFLSEFWGEVIISSFLFINFVLRSITLCSKIRKKGNLMKLHNSRRIFLLQKMCKILPCTHCVIAFYSHLFEQECIVVVCVCVYCLYMYVTTVF